MCIHTYYAFLVQLARTRNTERVEAAGPFGGDTREWKPVPFDVPDIARR